MPVAGCPCDRGVPNPRVGRRTPDPRKLNPHIILGGTQRHGCETGLGERARLARATAAQPSLAIGRTKSYTAIVQELDAGVFEGALQGRHGWAMG